MTIKEALKIWEEKTGQVAVESKVVKLLMQQPMIVKLDAALGTLLAVE
jgi:type IV secretory pathway TrbF-like protein